MDVLLRIAKGVKNSMILAALVGSWAGDAWALGIERISPSGDDVPSGGQIVIHFDRPVASLGAGVSELGADIVTVTPALGCHWRWLDPRSLACEPSAPNRIAPATRYRVKIDRGLQALDGSTLARAHLHQFVTSRPRPLRAHVRTWLDPGTPVFLLRFSQAVTHESVARHIYLRSSDPPQTRHSVRIAPNRRDGYTALAQLPRPTTHSQLHRAMGEPARDWLIAPSTALPDDTTVRLMSEPGLKGLGPLPGVTHSNLLELHTFPAFRFLGVRCHRISDGQQVDLDAERMDATRSCDPLEDIALRFSAPVAASSVARALNIEPAPNSANGPFTWPHPSDSVYLARVHRKNGEYLVRLPLPLRAYTRYQLRATSLLRDVFGRALAHRLDHVLLTTHRRPRVALTHREAVLESDIDSDVPVYATNLAHLSARFRRDTLTHSDSDLEHDIALSSIEDQSIAHRLGVRTMLNAHSGTVSGRLMTQPHTRDRQSRFFAQVTPFAVTAKLGHFRSLVWVAKFANAHAVAGARVVLARAGNHRMQVLPEEVLATGITNEDGLVELPGLGELDPQLSSLYAGSDHEQQLVLRVEHDADVALLPLTHRYRIWTRDVWPNTRAKFGHLRAWGTTAQGIYRAGQDINYKLYLRHQDKNGLIPAPQQQYRLRVIDPKGQPHGDDRIFVPSRFGATHGTIHTTPDGAVGWYQFQVRTADDAHAIDAFRVLVSDFTAAAFKVETTLNATRYQAGDALEVESHASLHAGGPFTSGSVHVRGHIEARPFHSRHPSTRRFHFGAPRALADQSVLDKQQQLNAQGNAHARVTLPEGAIIHGAVIIESAVRDDRGKHVATRSEAIYLSRDRLIGIHNPHWMRKVGEPTSIDLVVVHTDGAPISGVPIAVSIEREQRYAARMRSAGNVYLNSSSTQWLTEGRCQLRSSVQPVQCNFAPSQAGLYRLRATIVDSRQRTHSSTTELWVSGSEHVLWHENATAALEIVADKSNYVPGDHARFLVKNPFPGAMALVTVERYAVLRSFVRRLEGSTPVITVDIQPEDVPGFYLGVSVLSPRVGAPPVTTTEVDLGKPALRVGYLRVPVTDTKHQLSVVVDTDKTKYKPREQVTVHIEVTDPKTQAAPASEVALAVVDEAVLDLLHRGERAYDPYAGFNRLEELDVVTFSLITRLLGRQAFERKGASAPGDGANGFSLRELFRHVSYWNPSLITDANGRAQAQFTVPDNLTGWRVLAIAVTPGAEMGLGQARIKVNQPTELRTVMPNQLREGDSLHAGFTVLNRSEHTRELNVRINASGDALKEAIERQHQVKLEPFQRQSLWLPIPKLGAGTLRLRAFAGDELDTDALSHQLAVRKQRRLKHFAVHGELPSPTATSDTTAMVSIPIAFPTDIHTDIGALQIDVSTSLLRNVDGAFHYMRDYPYACWEQRLSKAWMASLFQRLKPHLKADIDWPSHQSLPRVALQDAAKFQAPNGGMAYWLARDELVSPYLSAFTAIAFNALSAAGHTPPKEVEIRLHRYLKQLLRRDSTNSLASPSLKYTVRAMALAALAEHHGATGEQIARLQSKVPQMTLLGKAYFLRAQLRSSIGEKDLTTTVDNILSHAHESAGGIALNERRDAHWDTIHASSARSHCAVLHALIETERTHRWNQPLTGVTAKLVRTIVTDRGTRRHWRNTQENLICMSALAHYSADNRLRRAFTVAASLDDEPLGKFLLQGIDATGMRITRPITADDPGRQRVLQLRRDGGGRGYYRAELSVAPHNDSPQSSSAGLEIRRELSVRHGQHFKLLTGDTQVRRGDVVRVDLYLTVPAMRHFVVVDDPVPGALEPLNSELATTANSDADALALPDGGHWQTRNDWRVVGSEHDGFYHRELRHHAVRFFSDRLLPGHYRLSYIAQVIATGEFSQPAVRAEEMYNPDVHAHGQSSRLRIDE